MPRIVVIGGPRTGKTTYATKLAREFKAHLASTGKRTEDESGLVSTDNYMRRANWGTLPDVVLKDLRARDNWVLEGTQAARVLRRALKEDPTFKVDKVLVFGQPWVARTPGQEAMAKGVRTILRDMAPLLQKAGIEVEHMTPPALSESERAAERAERLAEATVADDAPVDAEPEAVQDTP